MKPQIRFSSVFQFYEVLPRGWFTPSINLFIFNTNNETLEKVTKLCLMLSLICWDVLGHIKASSVCWFSSPYSLLPPWSCYNLFLSWITFPIPMVIIFVLLIFLQQLVCVWKERHEVIVPKVLDQSTNDVKYYIFTFMLFSILSSHSNCW